MGIFISHSSLDNTETMLIRDWLVANGWGKSQVFLDLENLYAGDRWRQQLNAQGLSCDAVILCLSDNWLRSHECVREHTFAEAAGKPILPVIVKPISERIPSFITDLQLANIADPRLRDDGFASLTSALQKARIGPTYFPWPPRGEPGRCPYRGLRTLEEVDAGVFFGRDAAIAKGLDALRRMRGGNAERLLVILGASGAGKSSFLRAGLLARLGRDTENYIVLPVVRPERAALSGPRGLLRALGVNVGISPKALADRFAAVRQPVIDRLGKLAAASGEPWNGRPPTLVLPIDQCEEFFIADHTEASVALDLLAAAFAADANLVGVLTIRSDCFDRLQSETRLFEIPRLPFDLPGLSPAAFKEVIEGPGRLAQPPIEIDPALTERLLKDLNSADALPLLAFALERLALDHGTDGKLGMREYEEGLKGLAGAITKAVDAAFEAALNDSALPNTRVEIEALARQAFVPWLVRLDDMDAAFRRRIAVASKLPAATRPLISHFISQRLLVSDAHDSGGATVEVAHEAVLREWPMVKRWIEEERELLLAKSMIERELLENSASKKRSREASLLFGMQYDRALLVYHNRREVLSEEEIQFIEESRSLVDKVNRYRSVRMAALDRYVRPLLVKRIEEISSRVTTMKEKQRSRSQRSMPGFGEMKEAEAEINLIMNFFPDAARWHPAAAVSERCLGPDADYAEMYVFPCCGAHVIADNEAPDQFRADGCEGPPQPGGGGASANIP